MNQFIFNILKRIKGLQYWCMKGLGYLPNPYETGYDSECCGCCYNWYCYYKIRKDMKIKTEKEQ